MSTVKFALQKRKEQFYEFLLKLSEKYKTGNELCDQFYDMELDEFIYEFKTKIIPLSNSAIVINELLKKINLTMEDIELEDITKFKKYIELFSKFISNI